MSIFYTGIILCLGLFGVIAPHYPYIYALRIQIQLDSRRCGIFRIQYYSSSEFPTTGAGFQ